VSVSLGCVCVLRLGRGRVCVLRGEYQGAVVLDGQHSVVQVGTRQGWRDGVLAHAQGGWGV